MLADGIRTMAETSLNKIAAKVAVHAVVRLAGNVAGISGRIDLHMQMAALADAVTFTRWQKREVAADDDAYRLLWVIAEFDDRTGRRPDDFQGWLIFGLGRPERQ
ncbi:hypothetical protein BQ8794_150068 [Mesorhizobium prunaredense]|uniref:Uncharacterized protein n=1 Tax=Mesorhizobium prunaredense TaxID=1631249 RepID=A0A1R3V6H4_9HYPH|nr:hypothetical protein BQ8794_150068 [Mesorhizobium prunaredense]